MALYLLDTDIVTLHQRNHVRVCAGILSRLPEEVGITIITVEEQLRGRLAQAHRARTGGDRVLTYAWLQRTLEYFAGLPICSFDARADVCYQELRRQHPRLGVQDLKIAAIALVNTATVVTRNLVDFSQISQLKCEDWSL